MPPIPTPPPDASGGFLVIKYSNGSKTHFMRVHINQFGFSNPANPAIPHDQSYNSAATGQEAMVSATYNALCGFLAPFYPTAWQFSLSALYQIVAGSNNPTQVAQPPAVGVVNGSSTGAETNFPEVESIYNFKTVGGRRARIVLVGNNNAAPGSVPATVAANASGGMDNKLVAYLTGSATQIVGHDGTQLIAPAHGTYPYNRRLRRHYGHA